MNPPSDTLEEAVGFLTARDNFLLSSHDPLDADAVGSEIALGLALESIGKTVTIANDGPAPANLRFLSEYDRVVNLREKPLSERFAVMATVDCGGYANLRGSLGLLREGAEIINIDHHIGNEFYGKVNYVDAEASAAGTLVYRIIRALDIELTEPMATSLLAALSTDTGRFSYSNTVPETHEIAAALLRGGARPEEVFQQIYRNKPLSLVQLEAAVAQSIKLAHDGEIAVVHSTIELCQRFGIAQRDAHDLIDIPMQIKGVEVALLCREMTPETTKVSFRSSGRIDVNAIAAEFGGGGHRLASGCRLPLPPAEAEVRLVAAVEASLSSVGP